jgi:hypothetical protein
VQETWAPGRKKKKGLMGPKFWVSRPDELGWIQPSECSSMDGAVMGR